MEKRAMGMGRWAAAVLLVLGLAAAAQAQTANRVSNPFGMTFVRIPAGNFTMGSPDGEPGRYGNEGPQHGVTISQAFELQTTEVTQGQWEAVMGTNPSRFKNAGKDAPVEQVSWEDCQEFVRKLNERDPGKGYRLPTEAEWEYACRAGTSTALYSGPLTIRGANNGPELDAVAWYGGNSGVSYEGGLDSSGWPEKQYNHTKAGTHPVGQKKPNSWGLYDMLGNVWEWCSDWYDEYPSGSVTDPRGPSSGSLRVDRGGGWGDGARYCRAADRGGIGTGYRGCELGFRLARSAR